MRALLDINVISALLDPGHVMHAAARRWMVREIDHGCATCPIIENGVVRILSQRAYPNHNPGHAFWPDPISMLEPGLIRWERLLGPRQITDSDLLALPVEHGDCFVSFDQRIRVDLVRGASATHLARIEVSDAEGGSASPADLQLGGGGGVGIGPGDQLPPRRNLLR